MSQSAKKLGLTQASITLQIQSLERDLNIKLFQRDKTKIKPTKEGEMLYSYCISYVNQIDSLFENFIKYVREKKSQNVDIASNHVGISYILPKYIKKFKTLHPEVKLKIRNLSKPECISRLLNDEIDMFIYPMNIGEIPDELEFIPIVKYQPILLLRKDHPLAKKKNLILSDIAKFELVRIDPKLITLPTFEAIIKTHGIKTNIEFEMSDWEILKKFVKADIGVAIVSNIILEGGQESDLTQRSLTNYFPEMTYGILIKKGKKPSGLAKNFLDLLVKEKLLESQKKQKI